MNFANFPELEELNKIKNKNHSKYIVVFNLPSKSEVFNFFTKNETLSRRVARWTGNNTNLPSNGILKIVRVNGTFTGIFSKVFNKLFEDTQVDKLFLMVPSYLCSKLKSNVKN